MILVIEEIKIINNKELKLDITNTSNTLYSVLTSFAVGHIIS